MPMTVRKKNEGENEIESICDTLIDLVASMVVLFCACAVATIWQEPKTQTVRNAMIEFVATQMANKKLGVNHKKIDTVQGAGTTARFKAP